MIDTRLLKAQMVLRGVSTDDLAEAEGWSKSTAYRKINGSVAFTVPEMQIAVAKLLIDDKTAEQIFFSQKMS